jgi:hypothetical protein
MSINLNNISNDYIHTGFKNSIQLGELKTEKTVVVPSDGSKTITFTNNFGMSSFGTVPSSVILRFSDGTSNHDFVGINAGEGAAGSFGTANQFAAGSDRAANYVVDEMVAKLNAGSLNVTAAAVGGNTSTNAGLKVTPGDGATVTITEDPTTQNSGNFGGNAGYAVVTDSGGGGSSVVSVNFVPFRFSTNGVFNLRNQTSNNYYKTFVGDHKN